MNSPSLEDTWPSLPFEHTHDTCATVHMWTQIVGKIRLAKSPWTNHSWHVTLYVTARGLTTGPIPYGDRTFQIDFDFIVHQLAIQSSDGGTAHLPLVAQSVATFYGRLMGELDRMNLHVAIGEHIYTTDFFVESAFNVAKQILAIYYFATALEPIKVPLRTVPFDFDEGQLKIYSELEQTETFRFINWDDFSADSVTLPIDKIVASWIKEKYQP